MVYFDYGNTTLRDMNNRDVAYFRGIGCYFHDNCFTCPFSECVFKANESQRGKCKVILNYDAARVAFGMDNING